MRSLVVDDDVGYDDDGDNFDEYARDPYSRARDPYVTILVNHQLRPCSPDLLIRIIMFIAIHLTQFLTLSMRMQRK